MIKWIQNLFKCKHNRVTERYVDYIGFVYYCNKCGKRVETLKDYKRLK